MCILRRKRSVSIWKRDFPVLLSVVLIAAFTLDHCLLGWCEVNSRSVPDQRSWVKV